MARENNYGKNAVEVLIGNVWEARNYAMFEGKKERQNIPKQKNKKNKRPSGLDALLGHLIVKIIPVTYQLSSTKISKYLSQK